MDKSNMKIKRVGREYELTNEELLAAYEEQKQIYARQDITDNLGWILDVVNTKYAASDLSCNQDFVNLAAKYSQDMQDSEDLSFTTAISEGVRKAIKEMEESGCLQ